MSALLIPDEVAGILDWWLPRVQEVLAAKMQSVMLFGGVTLGGFAPGWSDVDTCVLLHEPITEAESEAVARVLDEMRRRFIDGGEGGWRSGQAVDGYFIPTLLAVDLTATAPCCTAWGKRREWSTGHPVSAFDRYLLANHGLCWAGETIEFAPPARDALVAMLERDAAALAAPTDAKLQSAVWMAGMLHWVARSVVFWRDGVMLSKTAALESEIAAGSPFADAFALALRLRREGSAACAGHLEELRRHFLAVAAPAARALREHARDR